MSIIGYSPWQDAAAYGRGLGDTLGQILLQAPQIRQQQAQRGAEFQNEQQNWPLQRQLMQANIGNLQFRPQLLQQGLDLRQQGLDIQQQRADDVNQYHNGLLELRGQLGDLRNQVQGRPTANEAVTQGRNAGNTFANNLAARAGIDQAKTPISVDPNLMQQAIQGADDGRRTNGIPYNAALQALQSIAPMLAPLLRTNQTPGQVQSHWFGPNTTNVPPPNVTTNGYQLQMPQQQGMLQQGGAMSQVQGGPQQALTPQLAQQFLQQAGGNKDAARALARQAGYNF